MVTIRNLFTGVTDFAKKAVSKIEAETGIGRLIKERPAALLAPLAPVAASLPAIQGLASSAIAAVPKLVSKAASTVSKAVGSLTLTQKAVAVPTTLIGAGILKESATARKAVSKTPSGLVNIGKNIGEFIDKPNISTAANIVKENPVLTGIIAGAAGLAAVPAIGAAISTYSNVQNTGAVAANTKAMLKEIEETKQNPAMKAVDMGGGVVAYTTGPLTPMTPLSPPASTTIPTEKAVKKKKTTKKRKKKKKKKTTKKRKKKKRKSSRKKRKKTPKKLKRKKKKR